MTGSTVPPLPEAYAHWQERLAQEFFDGRSGQPIVMFVDQSELDHIAGPGVDGARSLASAVRTLADPAAGRTMFNGIRALNRHWASSGKVGPPPTLPLLALTVLAASEMRRDAAGAAHNYYIRLAGTLLPDADEQTLEDLRFDLGQGGAFLDAVEIWQEIDRWLTQQGGTFGVSTIPHDLGRYSRIGYPLSQTLVRRSDRATLTRFFDRMDFKRHGVPQPTPLLDLLRLWVRRRPQGFSDRFVQSLEDPNLGGMIARLIHSLAETWDGIVVTAEGLRRLDLRLTIDIDRREAWWVIPMVPSAPDDILSIDGREILITASRSTPLYDAEGLPPVTADDLRDGVVARGSMSVAEYRPADILVFTDNAHAGGWLLTDAAQAYEQHIFAVRPSLTGDVKAVLDLGADRGWQQLRSDYASQILPGYAVYYGITFSDKERFREALGLLRGVVATNLQLGTTVRPRLINGLPLLRNLSRNTFLKGGEPDLDLPVGEGERHVPVTLDGEARHTFIAAGFPIPLSIRGGFSPGEHTIEADGERLTFEVTQGVSSGWEPPGVGSIGWIDGRLTNASPNAIRGALAAGDAGSVHVLIRRGAQRNWIIDRAGHATPINEPVEPTFLNDGDVKDANFQYFEIARTRGCWLLQQRIRGWQVTRLRAEGPQFYALTARDQDVWSQAAPGVRTDDVLWKRYVESWEQLRGH
ncbi:MAG: hypothetical protein QM628_17565 [Propionicimonas sp.]